MDARQEQALGDLARILDSLRTPAAVLVVPLGRSEAHARRVPWPVEDEGRARSRKDIVRELRRISAGSVRVRKEGESAELEAAVPWPEAAPLFDDPERESREWVGRWLGGESFAENGMGGGGQDAGKGKDAGTDAPAAPRQAAPPFPLMLAAPPVLPAKPTRRGKASEDCLDDVLHVLRQAKGARVNGAEVMRRLLLCGRRWGRTTLEATLCEAREAGRLDYDAAAGGYAMPARGEDEVFVERD